MAAAAKRAAGAVVKATKAAAGEAGSSSSSSSSAQRNLFELARMLPQHGLGAVFYKKDWAGFRFRPHYVITRIHHSPDGAHGKAWGVLHWQDKTSSETRIRGTLKPIWKFRSPPQQWKTLPQQQQQQEGSSVPDIDVSQTSTP
eukprot:jgi/Chlat1/2067/Chrsp17S02532